MPDRLMKTRTDLLSGEMKRNSFIRRLVVLLGMLGIFESDIAT